MEHLCFRTESDSVVRILNLFSFIFSLGTVVLLLLMFCFHIQLFRELNACLRYDESLTSVIVESYELYCISLTRLEIVPGKVDTAQV